MNGVRSTFMRRGYLLTALSALLLLAASSGTALAQVTVTGPKAVAEGGTATYNVSVKGYAAASAGEGTVTVTVGTPAPDTSDAATAGEAEDFSSNNEYTYTVTVPENTGTTKKAFSAAGVIRVQTTDDADAEDEKFMLSVAASSVGALQVGSADTDEGNAAIALVTAGPSAAPSTLTIEDNETQTYVLELVAGQTLTEGDVANVTLKAVPEHEDASIELTLHSSDPVNYAVDNDENADNTANPKIQIGSTSATPAGVNSTKVYVRSPSGPNGDKNRMTDTVTLTAYSGSAGDSTMVDSLDISFADDHTLAPAEAVTAVAMDKKTGGKEVDSVEEGGDPVYLTISVDRGKAADKDATTIEALTVDVKVAPANAADASVTPTQVKLPAVTTANGEQKATMMVELSALADEDVGAETLMLHLEVMGEEGNGPGKSTGMFEIMITDATAKKIAPKATDADYDNIKAAIAEGAGEDGLNPGETVTIMTDDLFELAEGYTGSYGVSVEGDAAGASASGDAITIDALKAGESKITVTGTARMAGSSLMPEQTVSNIASLTFPVTVVDMPLMLTLDAPGAMEGNVVEGMDYDVTVTANRAVHEDTEVMFMRSDMSEADVRDYSIEAVTIMAGEMMATATLMVTEDMEDDAGHAMGEALHLYAMAGDAKSNTLELTIWDEAVPALPLIAQLLLALFLMAGGARLYRRRQS